MTTAQKIKRLGTLLEEAGQYQKKQLPDSDFSSWQSYTENSVMQIFGPNSFQIGEVRRLRFKYTRPYLAIGGRGRDYSHEDREATKQVYARDLQIFIATFQRYLADMQEEENATANAAHTSSELGPLAHLHPAVQQAVGSRFADGYYSDALHKACTALEKAVQHKASQPSEPTGAKLMGKVFSKDKALLTVSGNQGEQEGYMFLYMGLVQAIRNHYAHNDPATDPARALEWLGFISALFYKLDEALPSTISNSL